MLKHRGEPAGPAVVAVASGNLAQQQQFRGNVAATGSNIMYSQTTTPATYTSASVA